VKVEDQKYTVHRPPEDVDAKPTDKKTGDLLTATEEGKQP
jgi:hypothetical protein